MNNTTAIQLTAKMLDEPASLKEVFDLTPFKDNFVKNYQLTTGKVNGEIVYEKEKVLFFKAIQENPDLQKCTRLSVYSSFVELAASGLSLADGLAYIIPYGKKVATFQIGWKGRLEQIGWIPKVVFARPPQVVFDCDDFEYELGEHPKIIHHLPGKREKDSEMTYVYFIIEFEHGRELFIQDKIKVESIRDQFSKQYEYNKEKSIWVTNPPEAWKKTIVKNTYSNLTNKTGRMKALDQKLEERPDVEEGPVTLDLGLAEEVPPETPATTEAQEVEVVKEGEKEEPKKEEKEDFFS